MTLENKQKFLVGKESSVSFIESPAYHMKKHCHDALQILVPLEHAHFEIEWELEDKSTDTKSIGPGEICLIPPLLEHEVRWVNKTNMVNFYISKAFVEQSIESGFDVGENILQAKIGFKDPFITQISKILKRWSTQGCSANQTLLESTFVVLCNYIYSTYVLDARDVPLINSLEQIPNEKIRTAAMYMSQNVERALSIEEIAAEVKMSQYHFVRLFKDTMGVSPAKLHMMYRLEASKQRLAKTDTSIVDIAYDLGFSSQAHFSKAFAQHYGETPKKFRLSQ